MPEIKSVKQESRADNSDKLFDIAWAETDQYFVLVWAQDKEEAMEKWRSRYKEHWYAELFSRNLCGGPWVREVNEHESP